MAAAPLILTGISTAVGVIGAIRQGRAAKRAHEYNASIATRNANIARDQATAEANRISRINHLRVGSIIAKIGGAGIRQEGSAIEVLGDIVTQGELDKQNAIYAGELRAIGFTDTANLERSRGDEAVTASYFKAGSALLSGASQGYTQYGDIYGDAKLTRTG